MVNGNFTMQPGSTLIFTGSALGTDEYLGSTTLGRSGLWHGGVNYGTI